MLELSALSVKNMALLLLLIALLLLVRTKAVQLQEQEHYALWSHTVSPLTERASAGVLPGLMSDFRVLDVFAINYAGSRQGHHDDLAYLGAYLDRAQHLDPQFFDVYRLASSLLAYDAKQPKYAVDILQKGIDARPDAWEIPFFAGFIAHDQLKNDKLAFSLMEKVAAREGTPQTVITLAARFLAASSSTEDAIIFLKGLLSMLPKDQREGVQKRIVELELGLKTTPNTAPSQ